MKIAVGSFVLAAATLVASHYTFPGFINGGQVSADWQFIRMTENHYSNGPVTDVTSQAFRCYELDPTNGASQTSIATVSAGSSIGFKANSAIYHPGYLSVYMSKASPAANSADAGKGQTWFKVAEKLPTVQGAQLTSDTTYSQFTFTVPRSLPSGQYLVRVEQVALHSASNFGGAQFYISCAQVNVTNGGSGNPSPLVSIPGVVNGREPGLMLNIYNLPSGFKYTPPGPAVWQG